MSATFTDHVRRPRNNGPLTAATSTGRYGSPGGGPYMTLWLALEGDRIRHASFETYGCPSAIACGSMLTELVAGRTVEEALRLEANDLVLVLGGLPEGKGNALKWRLSPCATL